MKTEISLAPPDTGWTRCRYFSFWDVPRDLVIQHRGQTLLLSSLFDEHLDEYPASYFVWELEAIEPQFILIVTLEELERRKLRQLDNLPIEALEFWSKREREPMRDGGRSYAWYRFKCKVGRRELLP